MATVTGFTAARMLEIEAASVVNGEIDVDGHLILTRQDTTEIDAGYMLAMLPDASDTVKGKVELATNAETITGTDATRAVTPAGFAAAFAAGSVPDSSLTVKGKVELATDAETVTGTDAVRATTPAGVAAALAAFMTALDLNDLSDVDLSGAANGQFLNRISGSWAPAYVVISCTSSTRPATPYQYQIVFETDTNNLQIWNGSGWSRIFKHGQSAWTSSINQLLDSGSDNGWSTKVTGDTFDRYTYQADGKLLWGSGASAQDTNLYRSAANILASDDDFSLKTAGKGYQVKEGSNAKMGTATLVAGTLVVSTTAVTASSRIFLTCNTPGGTPGFLRVSARTAGTSFTILSSSGTDTSVVAWIIFEPS